MKKHHFEMRPTAFFGVASFLEPDTRHIGPLAWIDGTCKLKFPLAPAIQLPLAEIQRLLSRRWYMAIRCRRRAAHVYELASTRDGALLKYGTTSAVDPTLGDSLRWRYSRHIPREHKRDRMKSADAQHTWVRQATFHL